MKNLKNLMKKWLPGVCVAALSCSGETPKLTEKIEYHREVTEEAGDEQGKEPPFREFEQSSSLRWILVKRTGKKNSYGLEILKVHLLEGTKVLSSLNANSGMSDTQKFEKAIDSQAETGRPAPEGYYEISGVMKGVSAGVGPRFYAFDFDEKLTTPHQNKRTNLGLHLDANRTSYPGSVGCIVFVKSEFKRFESWFANDQQVTRMVIDWGLGSVVYQAEL